MTRRRLPSRVHVGQGHVIRCVLVSPTKLAELLDEEDEPVENRSEAGYVTEEACIYVRLDLSSERKWWVFCHELAHAAIDLAGKEPSG